MTASRLRHAAAAMREQNIPGRGYMDDTFLAVADWLDAVAAVHWPKRHDRYSETHYSAEPEHEAWNGDCDSACWVEAYICNGCGTSNCKPEISSRALAVANAYLLADAKADAR